MSHDIYLTVDDVPAIVEAKPFAISDISRGVFWVLIAIGVLCFLLGINGEYAKETWTSFHVNYVYWFCVAGALSCFSAVFHICNAHWVRPIRRLFESGSEYFKYSFLPLFVLYFGKDHLFSWSHEEIAGKGSWLNPNFVFGRDIIGSIIFIVIARSVVNLSIRRDIGAIRSGLTGIDSDRLKRWSGSAYDKYVRNWGANAQAELTRTESRMGRLSPIVVMSYALGISLIAFDQVMSVDPHWYSTLFGAFIFMSAVYMSVAWVSIGAGLVREMHPLFLSRIIRPTLHDLGKLLFGFGIFWAYLFWSHYLPIWYGNMPEETAWVITRLRLNPWHDFSWVVLGMCFIVPFFLGISKDVKQKPPLLFMTGVIVVCGLWLQMYLLFAPTLFPHSIPVSFRDIGITLGYFGAFALCCANFLSKVPLMPFGDLYLEEAEEPEAAGAKHTTPAPHAHV